MKSLLISLLLFLLFISQSKYISSSDDISIEEEDEEKPQEPTVKKEIIDEDEFDDPELLHEPPKEEKRKETAKVEVEYPSLNETEKVVEPLSKYQILLSMHYEIMMIGILIIFFLTCFIGKSSNLSIANKWLKSNQKFFEDNYAHLGGEREYNPKNGNLLIKDSYSTYKFFASGRIFLNWMLVNIDLKKRQDLLSMLTSIFLFGEKDKVIYEANLSLVNEVPAVFMICKKKDAKTNKKNYDEIDLFTEIMTPAKMSPNLVLMSECEELTDRFFTDKTFVEYYEKVEPYIEMLFFTDRRGFGKEKNALVASFDITRIKGNVEQVMNDMTVFTHIVIDLIGGSSLKAGYRKEAEVRRREYDAKKSRELAEKNAEEVKNKKEELKNQKMNKPLTREQAQKLEEKEKKEQLKNQRKKMFKVVKN